MAWFSRDPSVLGELDGKLGSNTHSAYIYASMGHPEVRGIKIREGLSPGYITPEYYRGPGKIEIPKDGDFYERQLDDPLFRQRLARFEEFFKDSSRPFGPPQVAEIILLHEIGHAVHFAELVQREGGGEKAFRAYDEIMTSGINSLPLGMDTAKAIALGPNKVGDFRLSRFGSDPAERWCVALRENMAAYTQIPTELEADHFALGVLARLYPRY